MPRTLPPAVWRQSVFESSFFWDALAEWWCHAGTAEELLAPAPPAFLGKLFKVSMSLDASCMLKSLAVHFGFVFIALYFETRYCVSALIVLVSRSASLPSIYDSWLRVAGVFICRCFFWASRNDLSKCERLVPKIFRIQKGDATHCLDSGIALICGKIA